MRRAASLLLILGLPAAALAAPPQAAVCAACHGPDGIAPNPEWPSLAGQNKGYLVAQLKAFRDGGRENPLMSPNAKALTDGDIEALADHFSALPGKQP